MSKSNGYKQSIPQPQLPKDQKIHFSFEFYDVNREDYCISCWQKEQIKIALSRLKEINNKTLNDMRSQRAVLHFGEVIWEETTEKNGFNNPAIREMESFHFALLGVNGQKTRVYGVYSANVFYIVWFDLNHIVWPSFKKHT